MLRRSLSLSTSLCLRRRCFASLAELGDVADQHPLVAHAVVQMDRELKEACCYAVPKEGVEVNAEAHASLFEALRAAASGGSTTGAADVTISSPDQVSFVRMAPDALDRVSQQALKRFTQADANRDGGIDRHELDGILIDMGLPFPKGAVDKLFLKFDKNRDGSLSVEEFRGMTERLNYMFGQGARR